MSDRFALKLSPAHGLMAATVWCLTCACVALWLATARPWLGLSLKSAAPGEPVVVHAAEGPSASVPVGSTVLALSAPGLPPQALDFVDLLEESDFLDTYSAIDAFFERQQGLSARLQAPQVSLHLQDSNGQARTVTLQPQAQRPMGSLPAVFWFQLAAGAAALLIGAWVWVLRPKDVAVRLFAVMSVAMPMSAWTASVYSTRELAMPAHLLRALSAANHTATMVFGSALVGLFLMYPKPLIATRHLRWVAAGGLLALASDQLRFSDQLDWAMRLPMVGMMAVALVFGICQWRATRFDPAARAALRWFGLSALLGTGLFVVLVLAAPVIMDIPPLSQGYAFGFFLLMDAGLALGLRRYRIFELDEWAYRLWLWVGGALLLVALDAALVLVLHLDRSLSIGAALFLTGLAYLPMRNWLWSKLGARRHGNEQGISQALVEVSFAVSPSERARRWQAVLRQLFEPMQMEPSAEQPTKVCIEQDGLVLLIPATASSPALCLSYPWRGRGLFGPAQLRLAQQLVTLMQHADASRDAYDRGVREERMRIARDLHDDVGAQLLSGLTSQDIGQTHERIRDAMGDMRTIVHALSGKPVRWSEWAAEARHEMGQRLEAASVELHWSLPDAADDPILNDPLPRHLTSALREACSNVIKHARATQVRIHTEWQGARLLVQVTDDGQGFDPEATHGGRGLGNFTRRMQALQGRFELQATPSGTRLTFSLPTDPSHELAHAANPSATSEVLS